MADERNLDATDRSARRAFLAGGIAAAAIASLAAIAIYAGGTGVVEWMGPLGDFIGGILNPALSLVAITILLYTVRLQVKELSISSAELRRSAEALELQQRASVMQNFEATFFQLLRRVSELVAGSRYGKLEGLGAFDELQRQHSNFQRYREQATHADIVGELGTKALSAELEAAIDRRVVERIYLAFYREHITTLGCYFRTLYHVFRFIDRAPVGVDKDLYAHIARAQLSSAELHLLFYNGTCGEGRGFVPLIERYSLLKHVDRESLTFPNHCHVREWYSEDAFATQAEREAAERARF